MQNDKQILESTENGNHIGESLDTKKRRAPVSQQDLPLCDLEEALRIPKALYDNYAGQGATPLDVATALDVTPSGGHFRRMAGAAIAYGLTNGGYNAEIISPTDLAKRIFEPLEEGDDQKAKCDAFLNPRFFKEFLSKYNGQRLPSETIAQNVLVSIGVPREKAKEAFEMITEGINSLGLVRVTGGNTYVSLQLNNSQPAKSLPEPNVVFSHDSITSEDSIPTTSVKLNTSLSPSEVRKVYISHGKNKDIVKQLSELLTFGNFSPIISVEEVALAKPVPQKVMDEMRSCQAAVIHVGTEKKLLDVEGKEHVVLNENVLIEIGAAMALYDKKFILLVEEGISLPSNLQGMYEVRYSGNELAYKATMDLLKTFNQFRTKGTDNP